MNLRHLSVKKICRGLKKLEGEVLLRSQACNFFASQDSWQVLILLDGCRFDSFAKVNFLSGQLESRISPGTCTSQWAQASFPKKAKNIVYLSANPFISQFFLDKWGRKNPFYHLEEIWDQGWNKRLKTVTAPTVTQAAIKLLKKFPDHKLVLHYMQPHHPFIGSPGIAGPGWQGMRQVALGASKARSADNVYDLLKKGLISRQKIISAYEDNLVYVLKNLKQSLQAQLVKARKTQVIITADHGNCFGEYGVYAHPENVYIRDLVQVPWFKWQLTN